MKPVTSDPFLSTIFGGIIIGMGVGIVIKSGGSTDGTEIMAIWMDNKFPFSVGEIIMFLISSSLVRPALSSAGTVRCIPLSHTSFARA